MLVIRNLTELILLYGSEKMVYREMVRSRITGVQVDILRGLPVIRKINRVPNTDKVVVCSDERNRLMKVFSDGSVRLK